MNKQLLQRSNSPESLQLHGSHASTAVVEGKSTPSSFVAPAKNRRKILLLVVGVLAGVAVCALVAAAAVGATQAQRGGGRVPSGIPSQFERREQHDDPLIDMATKEQLLRKVYSPISKCTSPTISIEVHVLCDF